MLRSEAVSIIKRGLGFRTTQDAAIVAALKEAQRDLELGQTLPNWLLEFDEPIVIPAHAWVTLPSMFLRVHEDYPLKYINANGATVFIPRKNYIEAYQAYVASGEGDVVTSTSTYPAVYVQSDKTTFQLYPDYTASFTAFLTYYRAADVLDTDIENRWLRFAPNYLVGMAGMKVAGDLRDKGALERFSMMAKIGNKGFIGDVVEDELAGRPLIMGRNN